ncbi:helix-turn-helix domain-containing protein [Bradyrhizobium sp. STM 3566]|uniref:helix-turn-helix domain-containing protein n=1 Tax=Bradyrhizobium sp. STM 3566 TaxID=578928 RepID=UPI00388E4634
MQLVEFRPWIPPVWSKMAFEDWSGRVRDVCGRYEPRRTTGQTEVTGGVHLYDAGGLEIAHIAMNIAAVDRTARDIRLDYGENLFLIFQLEGTCGIEQSDSRSILNPGDCALVDSSRPSVFWLGGSFANHLSVHLPRQMLLGTGPERSQIAPVLYSSDPMSAVLRGLVAKIGARPESQSKAASLRQLLFDAVRQAFISDEETEIPVPEEGEARLERALLIIERYLTDERLTPRWLANRLGISLRTLQREFSELDHSVTTYIRHRRLCLARDRLRRSGFEGDAMRISEIALDCGFSDISYFNRCFREAFDCKPGDLRVPGRGVASESK